MKKRGGGLDVDAAFSYKRSDFAILRLTVWRVRQNEVNFIGDIDIGYLCGDTEMVIFKPRDEIMRVIEKVAMA